PLPVQVEPRQLPDQAHEEQAAVLLGVLIGVDDVAVVPKDKVRQGGDQAGAVTAADQQGGGGSVGHDVPVYSARARRFFTAGRRGLTLISRWGPSASSLATCARWCRRPSPRSPWW